MGNNISIRDHLSAHEDLFIYSGVAANENVGYQAVMDNEIDEESHRWWGDVVHSVLRRCAANGQLARNQNYQRVLDSVYERFPEKARIEANNQLIIHSAFINKIPFTEADIIDLVSIPEIWDTLATSRESEEQRQSNLARERMISEMTSGGSKMFSLRTNNLNARTFDPRGREVQFSGSGGRRHIAGDEGFAGMNDQQLEAMYSQWKSEQTYKSMSVEDLRKQVRQQGKEHFEQKFRGDPGSRQPVTSPGNAVLIDPRNGQPITRRIDLIHYINSSPNALALLVKPKGTTIRERALEVDRLLGARE